MQNSDRTGTEGMFFAAYSGPSMNPTLREPEMMEVVPYNNRPVCVGDVAYFRSPDVNQPVVHRIVRITPAGISTLGDNNKHVDSSLLQPDCIKGRVVAAWRGRKRRAVAGGLAGRVVKRWICWRRILEHSLSSLLHPLYQTLSQHGLLIRLIPTRFRPRTVSFKVRGQERFRLLLGRRVIGTYDAQASQWRIQKPFKLFVNEGSLPGWQNDDSAKQHIVLKSYRS
jgi:hypothetical protein